MHIDSTTRVEADSSAIIEYMTSKAYLDRLVEEIEHISSIEEIERKEDDGSIKRSVHYSAPTAGRIPSFLKRYADRAPSHVHWTQHETWDTRTHQMRYTIVAEIKEEWQSYYDTRGRVEIEHDGGCVRMRSSLDYDVNVFGLRRLIERAIANEVKKILDQQGAIVTAHFG